MRVASLPWLLMEVIAWVRQKLAPKCPDCLGYGNRVEDSGCSCFAVDYLPCKLCRGTGRITDD